MKTLLSGVLAGTVLAAMPLSTAFAASKDLGINLRYQEKGNWCWAACTQMILNYHSKYFDEQCEIVEMARRRNPGQWGTVPICLSPEQNCCANDACACGNMPQPNNMTPTSAGTTREILSYHSVNTGSVGGVLSYADAKRQLDNNHPFIPHWSWFGGGGHAVLVGGYSDASGTLSDQLLVLNPSWGEGRNWLAYNAVTSPAGGSWDATMTTGGLANNEKAELYADPNFKGAMYQTPKDGTSYVGDAMNDKTSSARIFGAPYIFYEHSYAGAAWSVDPGMQPNVSSWNGIDEMVSSVRRMPGDTQQIALVLFENKNFSGSYRVVTNDDYDLHASGWGDRVSSLIVVSKIWQLYQHSNLGGLPYAVTSFGGPNRDGFYPEPASWGGPDEDVSSVYWIPEEWNPILLYEHEFAGRAVALLPWSDSSWLNLLTTIGFNDTVSSIKTYGGTWTVYRDSVGTNPNWTLRPNQWYRYPSNWGGAHDEISSLSFASDPAW